MCGENPVFPTSVSGTSGSPPRVRGKPITTRQRSRPRGITPACAGKTRAWHTGRATKRDHPRVCGENPRSIIGLAIGLGSPPRVRGKPDALLMKGGMDGITPACAGKTHALAPLPAGLPDHPRVCGENTSEMAYFRG